jgi:hypothetical protein
VVLNEVGKGGCVIWFIAVLFIHVGLCTLAMSLLRDDVRSYTRYVDYIDEKLESLREDLEDMDVLKTEIIE